MFAEAMVSYHGYTQNQSVIDVMLNQAMGGSDGDGGCFLRLQLRLWFS